MIARQLEETFGLIIRAVIRMFILDWLKRMG
jgi:hypothetical protein